MSSFNTEKPVFSSSSLSPPFLGWRARSTLSILSQPLLVLLLTLITLIQARSSLDNAIVDAKQSFLASCAGAEHAASLAASMPHFMAAGATDAIIDGANDMIHGVGTALDLAVHGLEAIIIFVVDMYKSLYLCLADFVVRGSLSLLIAATQEAEDAIKAAGDGIRTAIQDSISGAESALNSTIATIDKIPGVHIQPPSLGLPDLSALENLTLPVDLSAALEKLNASMPTLDQLRGSLDDLIATPFEALRQDINSTISNRTITSTFFASVVPSRQAVAFCGSVDTSFIDAVGDVLLSLVKLLIVVVAVAMGLVVLAGIAKERWMWKRRVQVVEDAREHWLYLETTETKISTWRLMAFGSQTSHPFGYAVARRLGLFKRTSSGRSRAQWLLIYLLHPVSLLFLLVGLLTLISVEIQISALSALEARAVSHANDGVDQVNNLVTARLDATMGPASAQFADTSNAVLGAYQDAFNNDMFGWANQTTTSINDTVTSFYTDLSSIVNTTFGDTPLAFPAAELVRCLIGSKVEGIQKALTFIHDNAHVSLPTISPTLLMLSPNQTQELAASVSGTGSADGDQGFAEELVAKLVNTYRKSLEATRIGALVMIALYAFVALLGVGAVVWDTIRARRQVSQPPPASEDEKPIPTVDVAFPERPAPSRLSALLLGIRSKLSRKPSTSSDSGAVVGQAPFQRQDHVSSPLDFADRGPSASWSSFSAGVNQPPPPFAAKIDFARVSQAFSPYQGAGMRKAENPFVTPFDGPHGP